MNINGCIICGSPTNLNTELTISINDEKVLIKVCDDHADDITPKIAKKLYTENLKKIDKILAEAKKFGLVLSNDNASPILTVKQEQPQPCNSCSTQQDITINENKNIIDKQKAKQIQSMRAPRATGDVRSTQSMMDISAIERKLPGLENGDVEMGVASGVAGAPLVIPKTIRDITGTTTISINKSFDDNALQRRFKDMSEQSITGHIQFGNYGNDCQACGGSKTVNGEICQRCGGSGIDPI